MTYASTSIDRRADYYARCAELIAADPLDFYTRAEKGRRFLASRIKSNETRPPQSTSMPVALSKGVAWLTDAKTSLAAEAQMQIPSKRLTAIAFGLVLTACQATPPGRSVDPDTATDTCGVASHAWLVGQNRDRIPPAPAGAVVRIVCSTCAMTMDFNASRLNIVYDEKTKIVSKLSCG